jgi:hypothetical protein
LFFIASPVSAQHYGARTKTGWPGMRIMCLSEVVCLSTNCYSVS